MPELRGGHLSLAILAELNRARFKDAARPRASRVLGDLQWRPAQAGSIQLDPQRTTWHTGHVHALLSDDNVVIAGTNTGGVWLITPIPNPSFRDGYRAEPLSNQWLTPNVQSLAWGPDGIRHVYAGCAEADSLFVIELEEVTGGLAVRSANLAIPLPSRTSILSIVVLDDPRRIVIGTDGAGAFWSEIPAAPADVDAYQWIAARGLPPGCLCSSLARGPGGRVVAGADDPPGERVLAGVPVHHGALFSGDWTDEGLVFQAATVPEVALSDAAGFVVASCASQRERVYSVAMTAGETIRCVLRSDDGGGTWEAVPIPENAGDRGTHNHAIGVSAYHENVVAIGWQTGVFLSTTGGEAWELLSGTGLHADVHDLCFPRNPSEADHLFIASDGGAVGTRDLGQRFDSEYNRSLAVLQFYGPRTNGRPGTMSVSSRYAGLVTGGTQDNGNVVLDPDRDAGPVWHRVLGGDGGMTRFIDAIGILLHTNPDNPVLSAEWVEQRNDFKRNDRGEVISRIVPKDPNDLQGLRPSVMETVIDPVWRSGNQRMFACAGTSEGNLHGLFANDDGSGVHFAHLIDVGDAITGVASLTGEEVLVGCSDGRILVFASGTGALAEQPRDPGGAIIRFEILSKDLAYALGKNVLYRFHGTRWSQLASEHSWTMFTLDRASGHLFAATPDDVFASSNRGVTWIDASIGLPAVPYCTDLRIGREADGGRTLYLSTYGRSVWKAPIAEPPRHPNFELPPQAQEILFGVLEDGGGIVRVGGRLIRVPPRQPIAEILAAVAIAEIAESMSPESASAIRKTAFQELTRILARAIEE